MEKRFAIRLSILFLAGAAALATYSLVLRPSFLRWGASDAEIRQIWPGDELSPASPYVATRAVTISASAEEVWRWVVQVGQDRAGFYSYTWLENLALADMHNSDRIVEQWQKREVGDTVWLARKDRYGGKARQTVALLTARRAMVLTPPPHSEKMATGRSADGTWAFVLEPLDQRTTRLILRSRAGETKSILEMLYDYFVFDPAHFIMERKMMLGIKQRAEACSHWKNLCL